MLFRSNILGKLSDSRYATLDAQYAKEQAELTDEISALEKVTAEYKETAFDKIKQFTKVQFLHWTEEEFSCCFRKMLTLEQYREPQMAQLYQNYLASGPLTYMEALFSGMLGDAGKARQTALDFYGPIFLLYSIYDGAEDKSHVIKLLEEHMDHFLQEMQTS